jgi:hypothetical protein
MSQRPDEEVFRERAYDLALGQLAILFAELNGATDIGARFEALATHKFMLQIAPMFAKFIDETSVEEVDEDRHVLTKVIGRTADRQDAHNLILNLQRDRLEQAGLRRRRDPGKGA